mgnify:FL=1
MDVKVVAVICLTALGLTALYKGIDSGLLTSISAIIGGIAGYQVGVKRKK